MKGNFDIHHINIFFFEEKSENSQWFVGFSFVQNCLSSPTSAVELIFLKSYEFLSLFLSHAHNELNVNEDLGIQPINFCGLLCGPVGNCPFLLSQVY